MEIKFDTDNNLPLNELLKLHMLTIIVRSTNLFRRVLLGIIKMLQYKKKYFSEGIDTN